MLLPAVALGTVFAPPGVSSAFADAPVVDRDAYSTTTREGDAFRTRTFSEAVNFKAADGSWDPIDRTLVREADGTAHPAAVDGDATIPTSIARPVVIEHDGRQLSFDLRSATGGRDLSGTKASFDDALPGVDVTYKVRSNGLKELITLAGSSSQRSFTYDVVGDTDLTATVGDDGELVFKDGNGGERFRVSAPLAWDSAKDKGFSNALVLGVRKVSDGRWTLTMRADDEWLDDPARVYPVTLDPDYYWVDAALRFHGANQDCTLAGGTQAGTALCASNQLQVGYYNRPYKTNLKFDIASAIPKYATATKATTLLWQPSTTPKYPANMRLRTLTRAWNNTATWDVAQTGTPWTTKGGDVSADANLTGPPTTVGPGNYWYYWDTPLTAVNGWIKGTLQNHGLQLSTDAGAPPTTAYGFTSTEGDQALWPALDVTWTPDTTAPTSLSATGPGSSASAWLGPQNVTTTVSALDDDAGVAQFRLRSNGGTLVASGSVQCDNGLCPDAARAALTYPATGLSEGTQTFTLEAQDAAGNVATSPGWTVTVDRTAPAAPQVGSLVYFDVATREATVSWTDPVDPALPGGGAGSGVGLNEARFAINGAAYGPWSPVDPDFGFDLTNVGAGDVVSVQTRATDRAGNVSGVTSYAVTIQSVPVDASLVGEIIDGDAPVDPAARRPAPGFPPVNLNGCVMKVTTGRDGAADRGSLTFENTRFRATGDLACAGNNSSAYEYANFKLCLQVKTGGVWRNYNFRGTNNCVAQKFNSPGNRTDQIEANFLCYPGSHEIRGRGEMTIKSNVSGKKRVLKAVSSSKGTLECNNSGAWRYLATNASKPGTELGDDLIRDKQFPPGDSQRSGRKGFDAHHVVLATKTTAPARILQAIAYSCEDLWPNESRNGVWLRGWTLSGPDDPRGTDSRYNDLPEEGQDRAYHPTIHTETYLNYVAAKLRPGVADNYNCDEASVKTRLTDVKTELKDNEVPYKPIADEEGPDPLQD